MHAEMIVKNVSSQHKMAPDQGRKYITSKTRPISTPTFRSQRCSTSTNFPLWQLSTWLTWHFTTVWEVLVIEPIRELEHDQCRSKKIQDLRVVFHSFTSLMRQHNLREASTSTLHSGENELWSYLILPLISRSLEVQYKSKMLKTEMECIKSQLKFWALEGCLAHFLPKATFEFGITQTWTSELALFLCTIFKALPKQSDSWKSALCRNVGTPMGRAIGI